MISNNKWTNSLLVIGASLLRVVTIVILLLGAGCGKLKWGEFQDTLVPQPA